MNKKIKTIAIAGVMCVALTGCGVKKEVHTIQPHETAFLIPFDDVNNQASFESEQMLSQAKVAAKQVYVTYSKKRLTTFDIFGTWVPDNMLIVVDRTPVTREWSSSKDIGTSTKNQAIYAESKESIGFSVGINCSAQINTEDDAVKFLYSYNNKSLSDIMDTEIRAMVEACFNEEASKYTMSEFLEKKADIMEYVRNYVTDYFADRGITITVLGMKDGVMYEDSSVQDAINAAFVADQKAEAQKIENNTLIEKTNAEAEAKLIEANAEAEANKKIAESLTPELLEKEKYEKWNGQLPTVSSDSANAIIDMTE